MKRPLLILVALLQVSALFASSKAEKMLRQLDSELPRRHEFINRRQARIDSLAVLLEANRNNRVASAHLAEEYRGFNNDSAIAVLTHAAQGSRGADSLYFVWNRSALLPLAGLFQNGIDDFSSIHPDSVPAAMKASYYNAGRQLYSYLASFFAAYPDLKAQYAGEALAMQEKLLGSLPHSSDEYKFNLGEYYFLKGRSVNARVLLEEILDSDPSSDASIFKARAANHLSKIALENGDADGYTYYLAISALADLEEATREVKSLQELGVHEYNNGHITRAHEYLSAALANAVECGAPLRIVESSLSLPLIESSHQAAEHKWRNNIVVVIVALALLLSVLVLTLLVLRHEMKRLRALQKSLQEANAAKEVYISQFLKLCSIYMDKLNHFCKISARKINAGQTDELYKLVKSGKLVEDQSNEFYEVFDNAFLHIYPHFVAEVNKLLLPDSRIELPEGEKMNTDLRILALMRLGIDDSPRIAQMLNYSLNTIYSYRNRLKARAADKENFEENIKNIN